jgi:hypothetical protein
MAPSLNATAIALSQYLIVVGHYFTLKVVRRAVFADMVPTCQKADIWECRVATIGDTFLHHVGDMSIDMSIDMPPACLPRHFMSVFWRVWPTCQNQTFAN